MPHRFAVASLPDPEDIGSGRAVTRIAQAAIVPVVGLLTKWGDPEIGGTSYTSIREQLQAALAHPRVKEIILYCDSPGGSVAGCSDAAEDIAAANLLKPVSAFIDDLCCSGAYYLAAAAGSIYANASAVVGSIGVLYAIEDWSGAVQRSGVKIHAFTTGKFKGAGVFGTELTPDQAESIQRLVDQYGSRFNAAVTRTRRIPRPYSDRVFNADVFVGQEAVQAGLVDKIRRLRLQEAAAEAAAITARLQVAARAEQAQCDRAARDEWKRNHPRHLW